MQARKLFASAVFSVFLAAGVGQAQTVNVYGDNDNDTTQLDTTQNPDRAAADEDIVEPQTRAEVGRDTVGGLSVEDENELLRRRKAKAFNTAGFGPANLENLNEDGLSYNFYAGRFWEVNRYAAIKSLGEVYSDFDEAVLLSLNLGANFYPFVNEYTPYVGAGMGFGYGVNSGENPFGFELGASVGALLFRTANVQMNVEGRSMVLLDNTAEGDNPVAWAARLGVLF